MSRSEKEKSRNMYDSAQKRVEMSNKQKEKEQLFWTRVRSLSFYSGDHFRSGNSSKEGDNQTRTARMDQAGEILFSKDELTIVQTIVQIK